MGVKKLRNIFFIVATALALLASSCSLGNRLEMKTASVSDLTGNFNVIFYGCNYNNDFETVAILAKEDSPYPFEPYAPDFNYRVVKGIPASEALREAGDFVDCNSSFHKPLLSKLVDAKGETLGFEVRPLYHPFTLGFDDALNIDYRIKDGKVVVKIRLLPTVERMLSDGGSRDKD